MSYVKLTLEITEFAATKEEAKDKVMRRLDSVTDDLIDGSTCENIVDCATGTIYELEADEE